MIRNLLRALRSSDLLDHAEITKLLRYLDFKQRRGIGSLPRPLVHWLALFARRGSNARHHAARAQ